jgi:hypothetical protein
MIGSAAYRGRATMDQELELNKVVKKLRAELQAAVEEGDGKNVRFQMDAIELELKVVVKDKGAAEGGIKFYVFNFGAKAEVENEQALSIKLKMTPKGPSDGPLLVAAQTKERPGTGCE